VDNEHLEGDDKRLEGVIVHFEGGSKSLEGWAMMHNLLLSFIFILIRLVFILNLII
jgi:hypothetical protein